MTRKPKFKSVKMWLGLLIMAISVVWALVCFIVDYYIAGSFHWFSASGAVMVAGSILFERMKPGSNLDGGMNIESLLPLEGEIPKSSLWLMKNGGWISIAVLIFGTLIWAYGSLIV